MYIFYLIETSIVLYTRTTNIHICNPLKKLIPFSRDPGIQGYINTFTENQDSKRHLLELSWHIQKLRPLNHIFFRNIPYFLIQFPRKLFFFEFNLMYCDLWLQCIQVRKLFKGGNYSRAETIRGNTVFKVVEQLNKLYKLKKL